MVWYPPTNASENGKSTRLKPQYFLVSALRCKTVIGTMGGKERRGLTEFRSKELLPTQRHPTPALCAVARVECGLLMDEHSMEGTRLEVAARCMAYTNHTLLPEALELMSVDCSDPMLPRFC